MRGVQMADIEIAARALILVAPADRKQRIAALIEQAHLADKFRKRLGKPHPELGSGTLMSAVLKWPIAPRPDVLTADFLDCLRTVLYQLDKTCR